MDGSYDYHSAIPWHILRDHFKRSQRQVDASLRSAVGEEIYRLQGESRRLEKLLNLPETLSAFQEEDLRAQTEKEEKENARSHSSGNPQTH